MNRFNVYIPLFLSIFLPAILVSGAEGATLKIHRFASVAGEDIYVGDIAETDITGPAGRQIRAIKISSSPVPGSEKNIPVRFIKARIDKGMKDFPIQYTLPGEFITVKREWQTVNESSLRKLYETYIKKRLGERKYKIKSLRVKGNEKLPAGKIRLEIEGSRDTKLSGNIRLIVNAIPENGKPHRILVSGWVERFEPLLFARHMIKKGEPITGDAVYTRLTSLTRFPSDVVASKSLLEGRVARRTIRKDSVIRHRMLSTNPDILKGDTVKLVVTSGYLTVSTIGVVEENGRIGEQVKVKNLSSGKVVTGQVMEQDIVKVVF